MDSNLPVCAQKIISLCPPRSIPVLARYAGDCGFPLYNYGDVVRCGDVIDVDPAHQQLSALWKPGSIGHVVRCISISHADHLKCPGCVCTLGAKCTDTSVLHMWVSVQDDEKTQSRRIVHMAMGYGPDRHLVSRAPWKKCSFTSLYPCALESHPDSKTQDEEETRDSAQDLVFPWLIDGSCFQPLGIAKGWGDCNNSLAMCLGSIIMAPDILHQWSGTANHDTHARDHLHEQLCVRLWETLCYYIPVDVTVRLLAQEVPTFLRCKMKTGDFQGDEDPTLPGRLKKIQEDIENFPAAWATEMRDQARAIRDGRPDHVSILMPRLCYTAEQLFNVSITILDTRSGPLCVRYYPQRALYDQDLTSVTVQDRVVQERLEQARAMDKLAVCIKIVHVPGGERYECMVPSGCYCKGDPRLEAYARVCRKTTLGMPMMDVLKASKPVQS